MQEKNKFETYMEDEIDLYEIYLKLKKHFKFIVGFVVIVTFLAGIISFFLSPVYKSEIALRRSGSISFEEIKAMVNYLNNLLKDKEYEEISKELKLSLENVKKIKEIKLKVDRRNKSKNVFSLEVYTYDRTLIPQVINSVLSYIKENPYTQMVTNQRLREIDTRIKNIEGNIEKLKKLRTILYNKFENKRELYLGFNPVEIEEKIIDLQARIERLKLEKEFVRKVLVPLNDPIIPDKPYKPKRVLIIAVTFISSLFMAVFLALFMEWLSEARKYHNIS
ncbi:Wzz/FepE/Etk N-terminal domain-containing protein [Thermodesulfobacterium hydrogeniphilum]|uniref:Wzz/FepE/Etk N-terminal domain-containing protein n=1 Tax=Thermodesulfobacterium hydrogeniphilum TaxID=161156 RepID=UPI000570D82C|nr:Wzz/FepE/Etk N-terminal domain-containing protein [Thermodesulfobacterium hydrogeniphilum]